MVKALRINNFPNYYITDDGRVYTRRAYANKAGRVMKLRTFEHNGYVWCNLCYNNKVKHVSVHRLVAQAFIPNPNNLPEVNHINGHKNDNRVANLEWASRSDNLKHSFRVLGRVPTWKGKKGIESSKAKKIFQINNGKIVNVFYGSREASDATGIGDSCIRAALTGRRKTAGGYCWAYCHTWKNNNGLYKHEGGNNA